MYSKYVLIFLLALDLVSFFPLYLKRSVGKTQKFSVLRKEKIYKTKTTEWLNELKPTKNELKMSICLLTLYLNHFNENNRMVRNTLRKILVCFSFFSGIVKLICKFWHIFFINLRLRQIFNLWPSLLFYKNLRSTAVKFADSAVCGNTYTLPPIANNSYALPPPYREQQLRVPPYREQHPRTPPSPSPLAPSVKSSSYEIIW